MINIKNIIESILFVAGDEVSFVQLAQITEQSEEGVKLAIMELNDDYQKRSSGLRLVMDSTKVQMVTDNQNKAILEKFFKVSSEGELSRSALETVSIIAYRGPITRVEIENIRGVNCSFILRHLAIRGLIERVNSTNDSRSYLYQVSLEFLRFMGVSRVEDLPQYKEFCLNTEQSSNESLSNLKTDNISN